MTYNAKVFCVIKDYNKRLIILVLLSKTQMQILVNQQPIYPSTAGHYPSWTTDL